MRQGQQQQQNRRGRGRSNNRKGQSPLARSFESNGPDVKIRGTPSHIAEKYMALARDSMSAGDPVLAENYLQHAEHYNRIIMAVREQQAPNSNDIVNNGSNRFRSPARDQYDGDDVGEDNDELTAESPQPIIHPNDPQPSIPAARHERSEGSERRERNDRQERSERPERSERSERAERSERSDDARPSRDRRANGTAASRQRAEGGARTERAEPRRRERQRFGESGEQPDFLRRPVRRTRREEGDAGEAVQAQPQQEAVVEENQD